MKAFIINLPSATTRRKHIVAQAKRCDLDYELFPAIEGAKLTQEDRAGLVDEEAVAKHPAWLTPGMIGGSLSHHSIYGDIVKRDLPGALIVEDDAELPENLGEIAEATFSQMKDNEIALLHYTSFVPLELSEVDSEPLLNGYRLMYPMFLKGVGSTACYIITNKAAGSLHKNLTPIRMSPDSYHEFYNERFVDAIRCVCSRPVGVIGAKSTIEATGQSSFRVWATDAIERYDVPILNNLFRNLRLKSIKSRLNVSVVTAQSPIALRKPL